MGNSISFGNYYDKFIQERITIGRYNDLSEVVRAGLRLLEEEENKIATLKTAINEGFESEILNDFDSREHLKMLKTIKNG